MEGNQCIIKNIAKFGDKYCQDFLDWDKNKLETNWWYALNFFFDHSFMRGRRDELSGKYEDFVIQVLGDYLKVNENIDVSYRKLKRAIKYLDKNIILKFKECRGIDGRKNAIDQEDFSREVENKNPIIKLFLTKTKIDGKEIHLGNDKDIMMVLDVLNLISSDEKKKNLYVHIKNLLIKSDVDEAYNQLNELAYIGDKLAALVIRDIILMNPNDFKNVDFDIKKAFPVDTWVEQVAKKLGYKKDNIEELKECLIDECKEIGVNPMKFAAGLWYLGMNSLDILIDNLGEITIK